MVVTSFRSLTASVVLVLVMVMVMPTVVATAAASSASPPSCLCSDPAWCDTIKTGYRKEIYGFRSFSGKRWANYEWDVVTTIAWADPEDQELVCVAHSKGVRVVMGTSGGPLPLTGNATARGEWVERAVGMAKEAHMDGIVFDYEGALPAVDVEQRAAWYVTLVNETTQAFHQALPGSQVSVCLGWSPDNIDDRYYDYLGLTQAADLAYIMDYNTRSQILGQCVAGANAGLPGTASGLHKFLALGADPDKLVLGVPWFGFTYPCVNQDDPKATTCLLKEVPFRGVNCSDAAGHQLEYHQIMAKLDGGNTTTGRRWDEYLKSPWFNYIDPGTGLIHQMWYDDTESLTHKYLLAKDMGLRGVGPFCFDYPYPVATKKSGGADNGGGGAGAGAGGDDLSPFWEQEASDMWDALRSFIGDHKEVNDGSNNQATMAAEAAI